jgi:tetratricopeptide (TPR) repeat protein
MAEADARFWLGLSEAALGRPGEAVRHLRRFLALRPGDPHGWYHLARACDQHASALFEEIGRREPESPLVYLLQAERLAAEGRVEVARKWYDRALAMRPELKPALVRWNTDKEDTEELLKAALAANPGDLDALYRLGRLHKKRAAEAIDTLLQVAPDSSRARQIEGERHEQATEYSRALVAYKAALSADATLPGIRYAIGNVYWKMRDYPEAERWLSDEIERNPAHGLAHWRLGSLYADQNQADAAIRHLEEALRLRPDLLDALLPLGRAFMEKRQHDRAVSIFRRYAVVDTSNDRVHYLLATALRALGRTGEAAAEMKLFQDLNQRRHREVQAGVRAADEAAQATAPAPR